MVLLKCSPYQLKKINYYNLHSTMVLLKYDNKKNYLILASTSTFHYGSIKICDLFYDKWEELNLHSTMVLLKL